ncbi:glycosyltransferase family 2 protein [Mariniflexile ostreae]|uniref:Glycosyltransferase family 2 protein n=1 Tax=Mariniflexile ostreae TaxID=1520892 RepID=A0ABV5FEX3_9FLAO
MLSVLIPTYNYNITLLVKELHKQCTSCDIAFEILVYDDGSKSPLNAINKTISSLKHTTFKALPYNLGRSAIRNLLGKDAQYEYLLFIDAGTFPKSDDFIKNYIAIDKEKIMSGGMTYLKKSPKKPYKLRWLYTKKREFKTLCSSNFMIKKKLFIINLFDESLKKYGYEDVLFFDILLEKKIPILFFDNPVIHSADDDASTFIEKTDQALENLLFLIHSKKLNPRKQKIYKVYRVLKTLKLDYITYRCFTLVKPFLLKNFNSFYPSIVLFDLYRIGYFCSLKHN